MANDERVGEFLNRPLTGEWPYVWLDATYLKVRQGGRIVPVAAIIAVAANTEGRREIIGLGIGPSEAETFWTEFLRSLRARGLGGVRLVIGDAHTGLKAAIARVFEGGGVKRLIQWINRSRNGQRCRVHWMRNALAHVSRGQHTVVAAAIRQAFDQPDRAHAGETWRKVSEQLRPRWPKLADLMDASEHDVLACIGLRPFLPQTVHWTVCRLRRTGANSPASTATRAALQEPDRAAEQGGEAARRRRRRSGIPSDRWQSCPHSRTRPPSCA